MAIGAPRVETPLIAVETIHFNSRRIRGTAKGYGKAPNLVIRTLFSQGCLFQSTLHTRKQVRRKAPQEWGAFLLMLRG